MLKYYLEIAGYIAASVLLVIAMFKAGGFGILFAFTVIYAVQFAYSVTTWLGWWR